MLKLHLIAQDVPRQIPNFVTTTTIAYHSLGTFVKVVEGIGPKVDPFVMYPLVVDVGKIADLGLQDLHIMEVVV